jgi:20S proteasome alpha/beta subunit
MSCRPLICTFHSNVPTRAPLSHFQIFPHGSTDCLPFATMGSGSLNAMAVFEAGFKEDMTKEEAMALVAAAIRR